MRRRLSASPTTKSRRTKRSEAEHVPGDAATPSVPVVDGDEHEEELERHHSASRNELAIGVDANEQG
jgi:hypothetical protein